MKKIIILVFFFSISITNAKSIDFKLFPNKSGQFIYKISGAMTGTQKIYFDNYGQKYLIENETDYFGTANKGKTYIEADTSFSIDAIRNSSYKYFFPENSELIKLYQDTKNPVETLTNHFLKQGGTIIGSELVNGYKCDIWEIKSHREKVWLWKSYKIRLETGYDKEKIIYDMTKLNTDVEFKSGKFKKPSIKFEDLMKQLQTK